MPVVQVFCPPVVDIEARLADVCTTVAQALGLEPGDVIATHVPVAATVRPGHEGQVWPVVVVHSSPREPDAVRRATDALRALAGSWTAPGDAWVSWRGEP